MVRLSPELVFDIPRDNANITIIPKFNVNLEIFLLLIRN